MTTQMKNECCEKCYYTGLSYPLKGLKAPCMDKNCPCHSPKEEVSWQKSLRIKLMDDHLTLEQANEYIEFVEQVREEAKEERRKDRIFTPDMVWKAAVQSNFDQKLVVEKAKARQQGAVDITDKMIKAFLERGKEQGDNTILWTGKEMVDVLEKIKATLLGSEEEEKV